MDTVMGPRAIAAGVVVLSAVLSGCAAFPFVGPSCGPGETDIGAVDGDGSQVKIKGEVTAINDTRVVLDDGTGSATVMLVGYRPGQFSSGDCIIAQGAVATVDGPNDVVMVPTDMWREEVVVEQSD